VTPARSLPLKYHHPLAAAMSSLEEYKAHTDWFQPGTTDFLKHADDKSGGQRTWSVTVYLNDVVEGGHTDFVNIGFAVRPARGRAIFWNNLYPSGNPNPYALHQAKPVIQGRKYVLSQWFRSLGDGPMDVRHPQEYITKYTTEGVKKTTMCNDLFTDLADLYARGANDFVVDEFVEGEYLHNDYGNLPSDMIPIPDELTRHINRTLQPVCEEWCGRKLIPTSIYGIRRYHRGTSLKMHRDRPETHIISAILNVAQSIDEDWPLQIEDHCYRTHHINMVPGDMVLYEGAKLSHGRPTPLDGDYYCNVFVHFAPVDHVATEND